MTHLHDAVKEAGDLGWLSGFLNSRPTITENRADGRAMRQRAPRKSLGDWSPPADRADPLDLLAAQNLSRVAALVPVRMGRMAASPFAFLRGSAAVMAADLARLPRSGIDVMACGDMHLMNFGLFASAERNLIFAINDFDEAHPGPWEWDLRRLAASAAAAARFMGGTRDHARDAAMAAVQSYVRKIGTYAEWQPMQVWYDRIDADAIMRAVPKKIEHRVRQVLAKARARGHQRSLERLTTGAGGSRRLIDEHPIIVHETHLPDGTPVPVALDALLRHYIPTLQKDRAFLLSHYRIVDIVRKIVGVGSVGTNCWVIYFEGSAGEADPLFLQVKEASTSVLAPYVSGTRTWDNHGRRVVVGQRFIQGSPDIFLGWGRGPGESGRDFYIRQLADMKGSFEIAENDRTGLADLEPYARLCGWALALAHAKSGHAAKIAGYCGKSDAVVDALGRFALKYADQTEADHARLTAAISSRRIAATFGV